MECASQGQSTNMISMIKWIRTSGLSINSLFTSLFWQRRMEAVGLIFVRQSTVNSNKVERTVSYGNWPRG